MARNIHAYFENMGETVVSKLSPHWSEPLWAEAQLWLAGRAEAAPVSGYPAADGSTPANRDKRGQGQRANRRGRFVDVLALGSLFANLAMVLYLLH